MQIQHPFGRNRNIQKATANKLTHQKPQLTIYKKTKKKNIQKINQFNSNRKIDVFFFSLSKKKNKSKKNLSIYDLYELW